MNTINSELFKLYNPIWLLIFIPFFMFCGALIQNGLSRALKNNKLKKQFSKGKRGESLARQYLKKRGFKILGEQSQLQPVMWVNNDPVSFSLKADFLVSKNGRSGIVEVKTGKSVNPAAKNTRRQILEYAKYYDVEEIFLFDADAMQLHTIRFYETFSRKIKWIKFLLAGGMILTFAIVWKIFQVF